MSCRRFRDRRPMDSAATTDLYPKRVIDRRAAGMVIADRAVLVTGANRGIGRALVEEALRRDAKRVYAGTRQPWTHPDRRVTPLALDVTNEAQIQAAVESVEALDILVNNAGLQPYDDLSDQIGRASC